MLTTDAWTRMRSFRRHAVQYAGFVWDYPGRAWEVRCLAVMSTIRVFFSDGLKMSWSFFRVVNAIQSAVQAVRQTGAGKKAALRMVDDWAVRLVSTSWAG